MTILLIALAAYLGFQFGRRWNDGQDELKQARLEAHQFERSERRGSYTLSPIQIRR